ncbi:MAG: glycosyltransferase, partial [Thaumarchaeota archaeon]|nr:glycosyltransferase [Candidatus Terraquivivens yellowstonensis]
AEKDKAIGDLSAQLRERERAEQELQRRLKWKRYRYVDLLMDFWWYARHPKVMVKEVLRLSGKNVIKTAILFYRRTIARFQGYVFKDAEEILEYLKKHLQDFDVVSFDMFDTLVTRRVEAPRVIQERVCKYISELLKSEGKYFSPEYIQHMRDVVEKSLREKAVQEGFDAECRLEAVIAELFVRLTGQSSNADLVAKVLQFELEQEINAAVLVPNMLKLLEYCHSQGKRIVITSDMYLPSDYLKKILDNLGVGKYIARVYCSSDTLLNKGSGRLYGYLVETERVDPVRVFHIGDNYYGDFVIPRRHHLSAFWFISGKEAKRRRTLCNLKRKALRDPCAQWKYLQKVIDPYPQQSNASEFYKLGYFVIGPVLAVFMHAVAKRALEHQLQRLYFCSRDGYLLKKIYEIIRSEGYRYSVCRPPQGQYLFVSRLATALPSVRNFGLRELELGFWREKTHNLRTLLRGFNLQRADILKVAERYGLAEFDQPITNWREFGPLIKLIRDRDFQRLVHEEASRARSYLKSYLEQVGFFASSPIGLIDVGWNGTTQLNLEVAFGDCKRWPLVYGFYLGLVYNPFARFSLPRSHKEGILYDWRKPRTDGLSYIKLADLFEEACQAPHPTVVDYRLSKGGKVVVPVFGSVKQAELAQRSMIREIQRGVLTFARNYAEALSLCEFDPDALVLGVTRAFLGFTMFPRRSIVENIAKLAHSVDWGSEGCYQLVSRNVTKARWKQGALSLRGWGALNWGIYALVLVRAFGKRLWNFILRWRKHRSTVGELLVGHKYEQRIMPKADYLDRVYLRFGTFARYNPCRLSISIEDEVGNTLRKVIINGADIKDNEYHMVTFDPIPGSKGRKLCVTIVPLDSKPGNAVTVWCRRSCKNSAGPVIIDGKELDNVELDYVLGYRENQGAQQDALPLKISVVIVTWNASAYIEDCLTSLERNDLRNVEVLVIDNGSTDGTVSLVKERFPWVRVYPLDKNLDFAKANNLAFKYARGQYVITLNPDTKVPDDFLTNVVKIINSLKSRKVGAISFTIDTQGSLVKYAPVFIRNNRIVGPDSVELLSKPVYCLAPCAAAAVYSREALMDVGGFDESFVSNWEDHDIGYRLWIRGWPCIHVPDIVVEHIGGAALPMDNPQRQRLMVRNKLLTYFKNINNSHTMIQIVAAEAWNETFCWLKRFAWTNPVAAIRVFFSRVMGVIDFCRMVPHTVSERVTIQRGRVLDDEDIFNLTCGQIQWRYRDVSNGCNYGPSMGAGANSVGAKTDN